MPSPKLSPQTTTLWHYPSQHYGGRQQGSADYRGATPSWVVWNLLQRYTDEGDLVLDPMAGSGTTLDVCEDLGRAGLGFDLQPHHPGVQEGDARDLPLEDESVDFVFCDPPYGKNLKYSGSAGCIGELDARDQAYFDAMKEVFEEAWRVLKPGQCAAFYVCDVWTRELMVPLGAHFVFMLNQIFEMVDHVAVVRGNKDLDKGNYHKAAEETNFFLRGFNHLIIVRKPLPAGGAGGKGAGKPGGPAGGDGPGGGGKPGSKGGRRGGPRGGRASDLVESERPPWKRGGGKPGTGGGPPGGGKPGGRGPHGGKPGHGGQRGGGQGRRGR